MEKILQKFKSTFVKAKQAQISIEEIAKVKTKLRLNDGSPANDGLS